jgi:ATP-dependent DNA helicase RecG
MADSKLHTHLTQLAKPLQFARRQNFAHLAALRDFERYVHHHLRALRTLSCPAGVVPLLDRLAEAVHDFDALPLPAKRNRLHRFQHLLTALRQAAEEPGDTCAGPQPPPAVSADVLAQSVQYVRGVGPKRATLLHKLSLHTVHDLLWYLPTRYEDRRHVSPLGLLQPGKRATFCGTVVAHQTQPTRRGKPFTSLRLEDDSGPLTCKWFQLRGLRLQERFPAGARVVGSGMITLNAYTAGREVVHPDLEVLEEETDETGPSSLHFGRIVPIYPLTAGLHQKTMRALMKSVLETYLPNLQETLPAPVRHQHRLPELAEAIRQVHFPDADADLHLLNSQQTVLHQRLAFEEFFLLELGLALRHRMVQQERRAAPYQRPNRLGERLLGHLPFHLTAAQHRVLIELLNDMQRPFPMNRLIQGDVGSGKTVVALLAMLMAVSNDFQAALMAPTEILAEQHLATLRELLRQLDLEAVLLTSASKSKSRRRLLRRVAQGEVSLIVGTHALLYDDVQFHRLGLIVVDEQHRFGVLQRARLRHKGLTPDVLVMTATPIPRTLAMTLYGDLDLSVLDELPPGRLPVRTRVLSAARREQAYDVVRREITRGHQAYIVYPLIEESESLDVGAAVEMAQHLQQGVFPEWRVGLLHGRLPTADKEAIMQAFKQRELDILVCTTVIEVGVDVPNATVMLIENAERFGLAQLHQLRGRVGRGTAQSSCLLIAGQTLSKEGRQRLRVMQESTDGFYVAEQDLRIRGPGELLGTKQSGLPELRVGNLLHHGVWLEQARQAAFTLLDTDPTLGQPQHSALLAAMRARWQGRLELASIG